MSIDYLQPDSDWDAPFYKKLAKNDTSEAPGHQGGMVLPKDLRQFLPTLDVSSTSARVPTTDRSLHVELFLGRERLSEGDVRYQFQTWHGTRSPESRITDGLRPIRDRANAGDFLVFQRRADALDQFRLILIKSGSPEFQEISGLVAGRTQRWGPIFEANPPVTQSQLSAASEEVDNAPAKPFQITKEEVTRIETRQRKIARTSAFRERVRYQYSCRCSVSGIDISTPGLLYEVEAAHIVPLEKGGTDDVRNGLALARTLHWAFDRGLFGILPDRRVYIPKRVATSSGNSFLKNYENKKIGEAMDLAYQAHTDAFEWHFEALVKQWD